MVTIRQQIHHIHCSVLLFTNLLPFQGLRGWSVSQHAPGASILKHKIAVAKVHF